MEDGDLVLSNLIGEIYAAASGDTDFRAVAPRIASVFNSENCVLQVRNGFAGPVEHLAVATDSLPDVLSAKPDDRHDPWVNRSPTFPSELAMHNSKTGGSQQHADAVQGYYSFDAILPIGGADNAFAVLGIHRGATKLPFSIGEKRRIEMFLPHLKRALQLRERLGRSNIRQDAVLQIIETLTLGVMLVTSKGQVQFASPAAEDLIRRRSGLAVTEKRLHASAPSADPEFQRLLRCTEAANDSTEAGGLIRLPRHGVKPITLSVYPLRSAPSSTDDHIPSVLIFIGDPDLHQPPRREVLAQMYGLTGAEAKLFEALLTGQRLQDYADRCSISLQTVKTQLSHLFHKTGSTRQADLVRDGLSNPIFSLTKLNRPSAPASKSLYNSITRLGDARSSSDPMLLRHGKVNAAGIPPYSVSPMALRKGPD